MRSGGIAVLSSIPRFERAPYSSPHSRIEITPMRSIAPLIRRDAMRRVSARRLAVDKQHAPGEWAGALGDYGNLRLNGEACFYQPHAHRDRIPFSVYRRYVPPRLTNCRAVAVRRTGEYVILSRRQFEQSGWLCAAKR
jgi:hypothetical protein